MCDLKETSRYQNTSYVEGSGEEKKTCWVGVPDWNEEFPRDWVDSFDPEDRQWIGRKFEHKKKAKPETGESEGAPLVNDPPDEEKAKKSKIWKPPSYYAESGWMVRYAKAIAIPFVALVSYSTILDGLTNVKPNQFEACTDECHYMRIFNSQHIPGTGPDIIRIENGISRPIAVAGWAGFVPYPCPRESLTHEHHRDLVAKLWSDRKACGAHAKSLIPQLLEEDADLKVVVESEIEKTEHLGLLSRMSFYVNKFPLTAFIYIFSMSAKTNDKWGMEHVVSARCPNMTKEEMKKTCEQDDVKKNITNHLALWGPSKMGLVAALFFWAVFKVLHDVMLLSDVKEKHTLLMSYLANGSLGVATASLFFWSMGAMGVFVGAVPGYDEDECLCYYTVPKMVSLASIASPFGLLALFATAVQMLGLASLYGDFLYFQRYDVPHYLAKQSYLWSWAMLSTPKVAGTFKAEKRKKFSQEDWYFLYRMHQTMYYFAGLIMFGFVAFAAAPFVMGGVELMKDIIYDHYVNGNDDFGNVVPLLCKVLLCSFSVIACVAGCRALSAMYYTCFSFDDGETFADQLNMALPDRIFGETQKNNLKKEKSKETTVALIVGTIWTLFIVVATASVMWGLFPCAAAVLDGSVHDERTHQSLAECELISACGFTFVGLHLMQGILYVFSTWDDLESLKNIAQGGPDSEDAKKKKRDTEDPEEKGGME